jgi:AmmeMemoRadiSam system protein B/AmmeMemoRadiSam system protein A
MAKLLTKSYILSIGLGLTFWALSTAQPVDALNVRQPVWAGLFYPADSIELAQEIDKLTRKARQTTIRIPKNENLRAIVMPHAGYIYSGWTAAHAAQVLPGKDISKVILLGPDHRIGFRNAAICDAQAYATPLGTINFHPDIDTLRQQPKLFQSLPLTRDKEHSLEVILPFLQRYLNDFKLIPVVVGRGDPGPIAHAIDAILDDKTLLVISSDLSHYLPYNEAKVRDRETLNEVLSLKPEKIIKTDNRACGLSPLLIANQIAQGRHWKPVLLHYANSGDTAGDRSRVVGYATIAYFGELSMKNENDTTTQFNESQGQTLVRLARMTLLERFGRNTPEENAQALQTALSDEIFKLQCGTFVTLTIGGQLRGCIGNLTSTEDVLQGVKQNAVNAALHDPRFAPLSEKELDRVEIEVSVLTEPKPLEFQDSADLIQKLRPYIDGVIIQKGAARSTFLPQVWEQLPKPEDFLGHLCMKAGLSADTWKNPGLEVQTYQVQYFEEDE